MVAPLLLALLPPGGVPPGPEVLAAVLDAGVDAVVLRGLSACAVRAALGASAPAVRGRFVLHGATDGVDALAAELGLPVHRPAGAPGPGSRSVHDAGGLRASAAAGAPWALLGPVFAPGSKPGDRRPTLGLDGLAALCAIAPLPVVAVGGVGPAQAADCLRAGAAGVAAITGIFGDPGSALACGRAAAALRAAVDAVGQAARAR